MKLLEIEAVGCQMQTQKDKRCCFKIKFNFRAVFFFKENLEKSKKKSLLQGSKSLEQSFIVVSKITYVSVKSSNYC